MFFCGFGPKALRAKDAQRFSRGHLFKSLEGWRAGIKNFDPIPRSSGLGSGFKRFAQISFPLAG